MKVIRKIDKNEQEIGKGQVRAARVLLVAFLTLLFAGISLGQNSPTVLFRNVQVADEDSGKLVKTDVLLVHERLIRLGGDVPAPADALVIDGGGNVLTPYPDGSFRLSRPVVRPESPESRLAGGESDSTPLENTRELSYALFDKREVKPVNPTLGAIQPHFPSSDLRNRRTAFSSFEETAAGRDSRSETQQDAPDEDLAQKVTDPSAPLSTISFSNKYVPSHWGIDDDENEFSIQAGIPYKLGGKPNIFRVTLPFRTNTPAPGNNGIGDVGLLNVTILHQKWGNILIGPVVSFGNNKGPSVDTFAIGPAIGAILKKGKFTYGIFNQNLFSFGGDISTSQFQPVLAYTVNKKVSLALGDMQITFDWTRGGRLTNLPASGQINYIHLFGKQPVRFFFNAQYNFINDFGQRKWTFTPGFALILK